MKFKLLFIASLIQNLCVSQNTNFISDNGFSGTFELIKGNELKQGSIVVENFKTSVGEFSGTDLQEEGVVFPWSCLDCAFEIANMGNPVQVKNTTGRGFAHIIKAAKNHVKEQQENTIIADIRRQIKEKNTLDGQRKLAYRAYQLISNTNKVNNLIAQVDKGAFLPNSVIASKTDSVMPTAQPIEYETDISAPELPFLEEKVETETEQAKVQEVIPEPTEETKVTGAMGSTNVENTNGGEKVSFDQSRYKSIKCVKTIEKLEQRLANAKTTSDHLIINEVTRALEKQYRKCRF